MDLPESLKCMHAASELTSLQKKRAGESSDPSMPHSRVFQGPLVNAAARLVRGHGFGSGTAGVGIVAGAAGALIGRFGLDIAPAPFSMLFIPWFMVRG